MSVEQCAFVKHYANKKRSARFGAAGYKLNADIFGVDASNIKVIVVLLSFLRHENDIGKNAIRTRIMQVNDALILHFELISFR